jgi:hypothetical protein
MMTSSRVLLCVGDCDGAGFSINVYEVELGTVTVTTTGITVLV